MFSRKPPLSEHKARRIAILKPSALGDIIHSLPVLTALRRRYPAAYIAWVVNRGYQSLLEDHPDLDETIPFDRGALRGGLLAGLGGYGGFLGRFRKMDFDLVVDLQGLLRSGLMALASGAERRVGLSTAREGSCWFYTDSVHVDDFNAIHAVDRYWLVAEALGVGESPKEFRFPPDEEARRWAEVQLRDSPRPWLGLGVGSRWTTKRWLPEHYAELAQLARERFGGTVFFFGTPDEAPLSEQTAERLGGFSLDFTGKTNLRQLAALLRLADVVIANDSGPLHLAAALGRPVVAPYTCTKVLLNGPYGPYARAVESRIWCQGSYLKTCSRMECMGELTPDRLWPHLHEILEQWQSNRLSA